MKAAQHQFDAQVASFIEALKVRGYSSVTLASYRGSLGPFFIHLQKAGIEDLREVSRTTLHEYQSWLQRQDYTGWTILARLQAVRRFFDFLEASQIILLSPCVGLDAPKVPYRLPKAVLTVEEAKRLLETPDSETSTGLRNRAILEVFYSSGIRLQEMTRLTTGDLDTRNGFLRVNRGKCAKDRVVPLGRSASEWVQRYVSQVRAKWSTPSSTHSALWLSSRPPHGPLKSQAIEVMVRQYGRQVGLSKTVTPHVWRHTCASQLVAHGANVAYVQRLLGHSSLRTTQIYVRTSIPEVKSMHAQAHPRNQENTI
jgi:integrase/recombinase XerD